MAHICFPCFIGIIIRCCFTLQNQQIILLFTQSSLSGVSLFFWLRTVFTVNVGIFPQQKTQHVWVQVDVTSVWLIWTWKKQLKKMTLSDMTVSPPNILTHYEIMSWMYLSINVKRFLKNEGHSGWTSFSLLNLCCYLLQCWQIKATTVSQSSVSCMLAKNRYKSDAAKLAVLHLRATFLIQAKIISNMWIKKFEGGGYLGNAAWHCDPFRLWGLQVKKSKKRIQNKCWNSDLYICLSCRWHLCVCVSVNIMNIVHT